MRHVLLAVLLASCSAVEAASIYRDDDLDLIVRTQTLKDERIERVLDLMGLRPGMAVLDIGAGTGRQARAMARRLSGTGRVYAADVDERMTSHIREEARRAGLSNIEALHVSTGVDALYGGRRYDRILMYDVYNYITDRPAYYAALRGLLAPGGRLVLVESEAVPDRSFYAEDVADWDGLVARILQEPPGGPFGVHLRAPLEEHIRRRGDGKESLRRMTLFHLNRNLDWKFYALTCPALECAPGAGFTPQEEKYALWLLHRLALGGAPRRELVQMEQQLYGLMQGLNKLLLIARYRPYLAGAVDRPYWSSAPEIDWYLANSARDKTLGSAGYRLVEKVPLPPFHAVWTFEAAR